MVVGFNHNFTYKGAVYHIQTEDSGRKSPTIVTLLYRGGTILASRKTSYADIARIDNLEQVVEDLMKEQHKGMMRSLKNGEFDETIARFDRIAPAEQPAAAPVAAPVAERSTASPAQPAAPASPSPAEPAARPPTPPAAATSPPSAPPAAAASPPPAETSLDEIILSYLMGKDK